MRVIELDPASDPRWRAFLDGARDATVFQHPAWLELLARHYRYTMTAFAVVGPDGEILVGLPCARIASRLTGRRIVALPFSDACAPVHAPGAGAEEDALLARALQDEHTRSGLRIEVRTALDGIAGAHLVPSFLSHELALGPDADAILGKAKSAARRGASKARREGVVTEVGTDRAALSAYYDLHLKTRRRQGVPTQSSGFMLDLERLFDAGLGFVMLARHEGRPVAGAVYFTYAGTLTYKYGASDPAALQLRPNNLCFVEAIRRGCELGLERLDFGRTDLDNTGLATFKSSWGAEQTDLVYTYLADGPPASDRMPLIEKVISQAVRRGPPATGQLIGRALYRHVG